MSIRSARPGSPLARLSLLLAAPCPPAASGQPVFAARRSEDFQAPCSASVTFWRIKLSRLIKFQKLAKLIKLDFNIGGQGIGVLGFGVSGFGVPKHSAANSQKLGAVPSNIQIEMTLPMPFNKRRFMNVVEIVLCYLCMKVKKYIVVLQEAKKVVLNKIC